ncbi:uncharacterized protein LOC135222643 isoform X1 [Macrobrachium nipponense]|uniref:uncharacterized protein LOC135222643 isoform X1 n=1 Tax=Macrobrachium nipponense TaxID=159736 RepID=UPI0030C8B94B
MDELLFKTKGPKSKFFWRPKNGRSIVLPNHIYQPFDNIVRTVHVDEALQICQERGMEPKPIDTHSCLNKRTIGNTDHPCRRLKVLWFGTQPTSESDTHDWYGNIQFAAPVDILLSKWKFCFLVELMTAKTHTTTRVLVTNTDYSAVLPIYNPRHEGGPWYVNSQGHHHFLTDCSRYNNEGFNRNGHNVEFMIEVTPRGKLGILNECSISFREHSQAFDTRLPLRCHRTQFKKMECPFPVTRVTASQMYFLQHERMCSVYPISTPRLSGDAEYYLRCYYGVEDNAPHPGQSVVLSDRQHFAPNFHPRPIPREPTIQISNFLNLQYQGLVGSVQSFSQLVMQQTRGTMRTPGGVRGNRYQQQMSVDQTGSVNAEGFQEHRNRNREWELTQSDNNNTRLRQHPPNAPSRSRAEEEQQMQMQVIHSWWLSLDSYCRDVMMWFWSQNQLQDDFYVPGWPTPQQHQRHNRNHH